MKKYVINEIYVTIHGEGVRFGVPHVFVRFSGCNLTCGFCDTEFESGKEMTAAEILAMCQNTADQECNSEGVWKVPGAKVAPNNGPKEDALRNVLFCGGEPLLQLDKELMDAFKTAGWYTVVETNGAYAAPEGLDWITCSPKVAEHAIKLKHVNEVKYVRGAGQGIPKPKLEADHYLISPMFDGDAVDPQILAHCVALVQANPGWRLTVQHHKAFWGEMR